MKKSISILLIIACFCSLASLAQNKELLEEGMEEKLKISPAELKEIIRTQKQMVKQEDTKNSKSFYKMGKEKNITGSTRPESELHAAINPMDSNNMVVAPMYYGQSGVEDVLQTPIYYTKDFGQSWSKSSFKPMKSATDTNVVGGGDPMFAFDANGRLYYSWISLNYNASFTKVRWGMYWAYSDDGGEKWIIPKNNAIGFYEGSFLNHEWDKQWFATDMSNSKYKGNLYCALYDITSSTNTIMLHTKQADSMNFGTAVQLSSSSAYRVQYTACEVDDSGYVHVTFMEAPSLYNLNFYHCVSKDGGKTFSKHKITQFHIPSISADAVSETITGFQQKRIYPCPHLAISHAADSTNGFLYFVYAADGISKKGKDGMEIFFCRSTDKGNTWSKPIPVNDDIKGIKKHQFHPSIAVNKKGVITICWYDRRLDSLNEGNTWYYTAQSYNNGLSFSTNTPVTPEYSDFSTIGDVNGGFGIGEYTQVLCTENYIIPFWSDGRTNDGNIEVYSAFITNGQVGIKPVSRQAGFNMGNIYPNPAHDKIQIDIEVAKAFTTKIYLVNMQGQKVKDVGEMNLKEGYHTLTISVKDLPAGRYFLCAVNNAFRSAKSFEVGR